MANTPRAAPSGHDYPVKKIRFSEIEIEVPQKQPGIYQIYTDSGTPVKVGISADIHRRLKEHRSSADRYLVWKEGASRDDPANVTSKRSILAKHLYFDTSITDEFDLRTEAGRRQFLSERCHVKFKTTESKNEARALEIPREHSGVFRYTGAPRKR